MSIERIATYRIQLNGGFDFYAAAALADYLAALGVSHVYCSPYLQAAAGSTHGYDVIDPTRVNDELGGMAGHQAFVETLTSRGLSHILDVVPNHMAVTRNNPWWWDVLENGPFSRFAPYFDVDWQPPEERLRNTILLPILGDHYGCVLEAGELRLERDGPRFLLRYTDHAFPVSPTSIERILTPAAERCGSPELSYVADAFARLLPTTIADRDSLRRAERDKSILYRELSRVLRSEPLTAEAVDRVIAEMNANPDTLDALIQRQNYRLAFWRMARHDLTYRRFFDINTLIGLRMEDERVFADSHALVLRWLEEGTIAGIRIDHVDGLRDPEQYLQRLRAAAPDAWIVVEKILAPDERLRDAWPIDGTTGYDFARIAGGVFVDRAAEAELTALYTDFTGETADYEQPVRSKKLQVLRDLLGSEVARLADFFLRICEFHRRHRDYSRGDLSNALREVVAAFPVYRTYVRPGSDAVSEEDVRIIERAMAGAKAARPDVDARLFDFLRDILLLRVRGELEADLLSGLQQLTPPAMAKGLEDTTFYTFNRFAALNDVGGDPSHFGTSVEELHRWCASIQRRWPQTLLATSTHDSKRSEDVRARLCVLSEIPDQWSQAVRGWSARNEGRRRNGFPDRNTEYLFYQTLVGAWPIDATRMLAYMEKAIREAKTYTSWTDQVSSYEDAVRSFVTDVMADRKLMADVERFVTPLIAPGRVNSLAQTLIKLTAPGVPDIYQGMELWDLSLVDPDNRRPVDYELRRRLIAEIDGKTPEDILARSDEGVPKLWVISRALRLRRRCPASFARDATYEPLAAEGAKADHAIAFLRGDSVLTLVPRLSLRLDRAWADTSLRLPDGSWYNELTGEEMRGGQQSVGKILARFPVALLARRV